MQLNEKNKTRINPRINNSILKEMDEIIGNKSLSAISLSKSLLIELALFRLFNDLEAGHKLDNILSEYLQGGVLVEYL